MGTDETCMAWIKDETGRAVGLPLELGGIPLDRIGATGFGLAVCAETAQDAAGVRLQGARVVGQGFGSAGKHAAHFLAEKGAVLVAASDTAGAVVDPDGIDVAELIAIQDEGGRVHDCPRGRKLERNAVIDVECGIWIPAARPDVIRADNVDRLRTELVLQGPNIPVTAEAEARLHARGILTVPDFIANAGGVICAAVEYRGGTRTAAFDMIAERIRAIRIRCSSKQGARSFRRARLPKTWLYNACARRCAIAAGPEGTRVSVRLWPACRRPGESEGEEGRRSGMSH
jgi:glutamate dehydrogenase (NAD(P)+)